VKATDRTEQFSKKKTMKTEQTHIEIRSGLLARPEQLSTDNNTGQPQKSYSLLPTPPVSEELKTTPASRPVPQAFSVEGR